MHIKLANQITKISKIGYFFKANDLARYVIVGILACPSFHCF